MCVFKSNSGPVFPQPRMTQINNIRIEPLITCATRICRTAFLSSSSLGGWKVWFAICTIWELLACWQRRTFTLKYLQSRGQFVQPVHSGCEADLPSKIIDFFFFFSFCLACLYKVRQPYCDCRTAVHSELCSDLPCSVFCVSCEDLVHYICLFV